jgi:translocation protein SEC66
MQLLSLSLLLPLAYLSILVGSMYTFSHLYRQRQLNAKLRLAPYFPPHTARNIYLSLLHLSDDSTSEKSTKVPDSVLRAALLNRAVEDIRRIFEIRTRKPALAQLLQRGVVGDEIFQRLVRAEQELEIELKDVVAEANALSASAPGGKDGQWGNWIFQSANEMVQNQMLREGLERVRERLPVEKERWEETRTQSRRELLGDEAAQPSVPASANVPAQTPSYAPPAPSVSEEHPPATKVTGSSDEDGVIVETPSTDLPTPGGGGGKNKKKKNKK